MKLKDFDFRVWDGEKYLKQKYNKGMFGYCERGYAVGFVGDRHKLVYEIIQGNDSNEYGDNDYEWIYDLGIDENDCEIELWTGLYDKNNKKIYEGDIVKYVYIFKHKLLREDIIEKLPKKLSIGYIGFDNFLGFRILKNKELQCFMKDITEIEVVGNIHENEDLLNTKE